MDPLEQVAKSALSILIVDIYKALLGKLVQGPGSTFTTLVVAKMFLRTAEIIAKKDPKFDGQSWTDADSLSSELMEKLNVIVAQKTGAESRDTSN